MEADVLSIDNKKTGKMKLPAQFHEELRPDLVKRAVLAIQSHNRQPYGAKPFAGMRSSAEVSKRRRDYRGSYGHGISRVPRKVLSRRGTRMNWVGAFAPGTVGGRKAHPPKAEKIWEEKINKKERRKAIRTAIAATINKTLVAERGHILPAHYPIIVESQLESIDKTKRVIEILNLLGLKEELQRASEKKVRAGKGKMRGRKYKRKKGPIIIISKQDKLMKSAANIPGVDVVEVKNLNAELLAPGADIGRIAVWTNAAIEKLGKEKIFM